MALNCYLARLSQHYFRLPLPDYGQDAYLFHWHTAISDWYAQDSSQLDYRQVAKDSGIDAVLEIGLGTYRICEAQLSLQVLVRLIDHHDNRCHEGRASPCQGMPGDCSSRKTA